MKVKLEEEGKFVAWLELPVGQIQDLVLLKFRDEYYAFKSMNAIHSLGTPVFTHVRGQAYLEIPPEAIATIGVHSGG